MRFEPSNCPACGQQTSGVLETISGIALLLFDEDGTAQYAGETDVCWNSQTTERDRYDRVTLVCPGGHQWPAVTDEVTDQATDRYEIGCLLSNTISHQQEENPE